MDDDVPVLGGVVVAVIVRQATADHFSFLRERAGVAVTPSFRALEAVDAEGKILGMFGYDGWTSNAVVMHVALDSPMALRTLLIPAFTYPFVHLNLGIALCAIRGDNERSIALTEHVGFKRVYTIRNCFGGGIDQHIYELRREECRWILPQFRKAA